MSRPSIPMPVLIGVRGASGAGKTALVEYLIPALRARGVRVGTIKHATHEPALDVPGKDSHRHAAAGAACVALIGAGRAAFFVHEDAADDPHPWLELFRGRVDVVLVEGYRDLPMRNVLVDIGEKNCGLYEGENGWLVLRPATASWPVIFPAATIDRLSAAISDMIRAEQLAYELAPIRPTVA